MRGKDKVPRLIAKRVTIRYYNSRGTLIRSRRVLPSLFPVPKLREYESLAAQLRAESYESHLEQFAI